MLANYHKNWIGFNQFPPLCGRERQKGYDTDLSEKH